MRLHDEPVEMRLHDEPVEMRLIEMRLIGEGIKPKLLSLIMNNFFHY
jgi:hypothetical protein